MEVDCSAGVHQIVAGVVDVDGVVLVGQVPLDLVPRVSVHSKLVVHLLQRPFHLVLARLDLVNLPHQRVLHSIVHHVDSLPPLPVVDAFRVHPHRPLRLCQGPLQVLPHRLQLVGLVDVSLQLGLELRSPEGLVMEPLSNSPICVPLSHRRLVLAFPH